MAAVEIQDKEIKGITGKVVLAAFVTIMTISSSFWVGYYKIQARFDDIENKREIDMLINKQVMEGLKQNEGLHDIQIKENRGQIEENRASIQDLKIRVKNLEQKRR